MTRQATSPDDIRDMADEVARLIAARFGGARRGERPPLGVMLRRRGGALPRRLRKLRNVGGRRSRGGIGFIYCHFLVLLDRLNAEVRCHLARSICLGRCRIYTDP